MHEYTQGIADDGAAILKDGKPMTPELEKNIMSSHAEKLTAGLRAMRSDVDPDAFVYFYEQDSCYPKGSYDETEILGFPVLRCGGSTGYCGFDDYNVPFMPVWKSGSKDNQVAMLARFRNAYQDT